MKKKIAVTVLLTKNQAEKIKAEAEKTGNSQNSIIRTALEEHFKLRQEDHCEKT